MITVLWLVAGSTPQTTHRRKIAVGFVRAHARLSTQFFQVCLCSVYFFSHDNDSRNILAIYCTNTKLITQQFLAN